MTKKRKVNRRRGLDICLALVMILVILAGTFTIPHSVRADNAISVNGSGVSENENVELYYEDATGWQVCINGVWVDIQGQSKDTLMVTPAMALPVIDYSSGDVSFRAKTESGYSDEAEVYIDAYRRTEEEPDMAPKKARKAPAQAPVSENNEEKGGSDGQGDPEEAFTYNITVNFTFMNGELAADPFFATINADDDFHESVAIPSLPGYNSYLDSEEISGYLDIDITGIDRNYTYNIIYHPSEVTYVVEHYLQNAEDDDYSFYYSETLTGYTLDLVGNVAGDFTGFYPLLYNHPEIAADGSTVVQIYYDRYYYLMEFHLDGGKGVDPIYAKYGMPVTIGTPSKNGYAFAGWDIDPPATVPIGGGVYTANWAAADTNFNVIFWYENTSGTDKYSIAGSEELTGVTGTTLDPDDYKDDAFEGRDDDHFVYNAGKSETVVLNGDGTTLVNVYFDRIDITFNFYDEPVASSESRQDNTNLYYTMTGRWGSTFAQNGVTWPSDKSWSFWRKDGNNSTMGMTFMDAFLPTVAMGSATTINFYTRTVDGNTIYFLREKLDGSFATDTSYDTSYLDTAADDMVTIASNSTFYFSEKYEGFSLQDYQGSGTNYYLVYTKDGQTHTYNGKRFVTATNTTTQPQYGVVDGELVELEYAIPKIWYLPYTYTATSSTSGTLYGIVESEYTRLTSRVSWIYDGDQTYTGTYVYEPTTSNSNTVTYYAVLNGSVVPVTLRNGYYYGDNNENTYSQQYKYYEAEPISNNSSKTVYYLNNGTISNRTLYYHNGEWCTRSGNWFSGYTYTSVSYAVYDRVARTTEDDGRQYYGIANRQLVPLTYISTCIAENGETLPADTQRYTRRNTPATTTGTVTYYGFVDGQMKQLSYENGFVDERGNAYNGQRYTRTSNSSSNAYTGTRYVRTDNSFPYTYKKIETNSGTQYGLDRNMGHQRLSSTNTAGNFVYNGQIYTGTRYVETTETTGTIYGFVDGVRYNLSRGGTYTGFGNNWSQAVISSTAENGHVSGGKDYIIRYSRNSYRVEYYNHSYFLDDEARTVKYEYSLADCDIEPEYPYSLPYGMYRFVGWYDNEGLQGEPFDFENETMPSSNVTLYAKYEPLKLTVNVYNDLVSMTNGTDLISTEQVPYGNLATVPDVPERENYTFVGWFYQNRYGDEMPFQFSSMEVTQNLNIYGKWTSDVLVPYTVTYETDGGEVIAEKSTNSALAGSTKTFPAKTDRQLYPDYREHWFPLVSSHSILMQEGIENAYTFVYVYREFVPYTVRYVNAETGEELHTPKVINDNAFITVTERYQPIPGYVPDAFKKSLTLSIDGPNEIIFYYTEDDVRAPYVINYYVETEDGYELYNYRNGMDVIGTTITAPEMKINGYVFNPDAPGTVTTGTITSTGLELNLYYDRVTYPYKVRYLERNTNRVLAPETTGEGYYEETLSFDAIDIDGYDLVSPETQSLTIAIEEGEDPRNNVVTFYYRVQQAEINYVAVGPGSVDPSVEFLSILGTAQGSTPTANAGAGFRGWFKDAACTIPVTESDGTIDANDRFIPSKNEDGKNVSATYYALFAVNAHSITVDKTVGGSMGNRAEAFEFTLTVSDADAAGITYAKGSDTGSVELDENGSYTFTLAHGETIVFESVPHDCTYSVAETAANSNGYITTVTGPAEGTLTEDVSISFENARNVAVPTDIYDNPATLLILFILAVIVFAGALIGRKARR